MGLGVLLIFGAIYTTEQRKKEKLAKQIAEALALEKWEIEHEEYLSDSDDEIKGEMEVMMMKILCNKMEAAQKMNRRLREACKWHPVTQKGPTNWNYDEDGVLVTVPTRVHWFRAVDKFVAELNEENHRLDLGITSHIWIW